MPGVGNSGGRPFLVAEMSRMLIKLYLRTIRIYDNAADRAFTPDSRTIVCAFILSFMGSVARVSDVIT